MDPYKELEITPDASEDEVKAAYRRLAKIYHPDANPGDEAAARKMNRINSAYAILRGHPGELFLDEDWFAEDFRSEQDTYPMEERRRESFFANSIFRRIIVIAIAASMAIVGIVSAFFSSLRW